MGEFCILEGDSGNPTPTLMEVPFVLMGLPLPDPSPTPNPLQATFSLQKKELFLIVILTTPTPHTSKNYAPKICHKMRGRMA